jgi:V/A-type H+-transporting ATPase subunit C
VGRISVLKKDALDTSRLERLLSAPSLREAQRALSEIGWDSGEGLDYEQLSAKHVEKACKLVRDLSPDPDITDCFLLRYDIHNLKTLLKARCLHEEPEYLSDCGTLPLAKLTHAVTEHVYKELPPVLSKTMAGLEKRLAGQPDAMEIDVALDHALYEMIFEKLARKKAPVVRRYFQAKLDMVNALMILRSIAMGKDAAFMQRILLTNGSHSVDTWLKAAASPEKLPKLLDAYGKNVIAAIQAAVTDFKKLPALEKVLDDYLLSLFTPYRIASLSLEPLISYLLAVDREAAAVRLILAGKANGFPQEAIRERMRELYGR